MHNNHNPLYKSINELSPLPRQEPHTHFSRREPELNRLHHRALAFHTLTNTMATTAPLSRYIQLALDDPEATIFDDKENEPMLRSDQLNVVLCYRGTFNPPHQSHKDVLCHAFFRTGGHDLNVIAAVVDLTHDLYIATKLRAKNPDRKPVVFTKEDRIRLWKESGLHGGWYCFWNFEQRYDSAFREKVIDLAAKDGYPIFIPKIIGGDLLYDPIVPPWENGNICVGGRDDARIEMEDTRVGLQKVDTYEDWEIITLKPDHIERVSTEGTPEYLEQKLGMLFPKQMENLPAYDKPQYKTQSQDQKLQARTDLIKDKIRSGLQRLRESRGCMSNDGHQRWVLFFPLEEMGTTSGAGSSDATPYSSKSSSAIMEEVWAAKTQEEIRKVLKEHVLSPGLAFELLKPWMTGRALPESGGDLANEG